MAKKSVIEARKAQRLAAIEERLDLLQKLLDPTGSKLAKLEKAEAAAEDETPDEGQAEPTE